MVYRMDLKYADVSVTSDFHMYLNQSTLPHVQCNSSLLTSLKFRDERSLSGCWP